MAKTPDQIDALDNYSNAQMVKLCRHAIAELLSSPESTVTVNGRSWTYQDLDRLRSVLREFTALAAAETDAATAQAAGGGALMVQFVEGP